MIKTNECGHTDRRHHARGKCSACYQKWRMQNDTRPAALCHPDRPHYGRNMCNSCWVLWRRNGTDSKRAKCHPDRSHHSFGLCTLCYQRQYSRKNSKRLLEQKRKRYAATRSTVIQELGGKCECCGEHAKQFLSIHHRNRDGQDHRKRAGGHDGMLRDIRDRGFPTDKYAILCHNCHFGKEWYGKCH